MKHLHTATLVHAMLVAAISAHALDLSIAAEPYIRSCVYTDPVLPIEATAFKIGIEALVSGNPPTPPTALVKIVDAADTTVFESRAELQKENAAAGESPAYSTEIETTLAKNGMYRLVAVLDPDNAIAEDNESNNTAELVLPVIVSGRELFFPWYSESDWVRWANVITSVPGEDAPALEKRGIKALNWEYGGFSWSYFDDKRLFTEHEKAMQELEELFFQKYAGGELPNQGGFGIDEIGGYPDSARYFKSVASMRALVRAREARPDSFFAVWYGGWTGETLAGLLRQSADLVLLETYVWRAQPSDLGTEDIYQVIRNKLDPFIRSIDMFVPAYGNKCRTLVAFETSERPDWVDLGEQEQIVRYVRRIAPEMRGIAYYNSGYGGYGLQQTQETDRMNEASVRNADRLCLEYFIKPCVTLQPESLWTRITDAGVELTAAVSNIGAMDSGPVAVRFQDNGVDIGQVELTSVPAGPNRNENRAKARLVMQPAPGPHRFTAQIASAPGATVLDSEVEEARLVQ